MKPKKHKHRWGKWRATGYSNGNIRVYRSCESPDCGECEEMGSVEFAHLLNAPRPKFVRVGWANNPYFDVTFHATHSRDEFHQHAIYAQRRKP